MSKLFLVLGPESSGNHLVCKTLHLMGAKGTCQNGAFQLLDAYVYGKRKEDKGLEPSVSIKTELTTDIRSILGTYGGDIYLRRSIPYGQDWPDLQYIKQIFLEEGYTMHTLVLVRDWASNILSNYYVRMNEIEDAIEAQKTMWCWIGERLKTLHPFTFINTSFMMKDPEPVIKQIELFTGLTWPQDAKPKEVIYDSDKRRHQKFLEYGYNITSRQVLQG